MDIAIGISGLSILFLCYCKLCDIAYDTKGTKDSMEKLIKESNKVK